ncbi:hypothetical protein Droror1_Dr00000556 [Drosera rotundifolia]
MGRIGRGESSVGNNCDEIEESIQQLGKNLRLTGTERESIDLGSVTVADNATKRIVDYEFNHLWIWMQCDLLPLGYRSQGVVTMVGKKVGRVLEVDVDENGATRANCSRANVEIDISRPLVRGFYVTLKNG